MDKVEKIVMYRTADFGDPVAIEVGDMTTITYTSARDEPHSVIVGETTFVWQNLDGYCGSFTGEFPTPVVEYKPAGQDIPEQNPDWHDERFYIRPNMWISVSLYTSGSLLKWDIEIYVGETRICNLQAQDSSTVHPSIAIRFGYFKERLDSSATPTGDTSIGVFILTGYNETTHMGNLSARWISENYWDGSFEPLPTTPSHANAVTPTGFSGGRSTESTDYVPGSAFRSLGVLTATGNGLHMYKINTTVYANIMDEIWVDSIKPDELRDYIKNKIFQPTSGMLSLHRLPVSISGQTVNGINVCGTRYVKNSSVTAVTTQHVSVPADGSTWNIDLRPSKEWTESFLDWNPYVLAIVTLPFIGNVEVNVNYFVYGIVKLRYIIDVINGNCMAELSTTDCDDHELIIGRYCGNCAYMLPIFGNSLGGTPILGMATAVTSAIAVGATIATGGMGAAGAATAGENAAFTAKAVAASANSAAMIAKSVTTPHQLVSSGSLPANASALAGDLYPRLHLYYKNDVTILDDHMQDMLQKFMGRDASVYCKLGALEGKGFISGVFHADNVPYATDTEKTELEQLLAEGVFWV